MTTPALLVRDLAHARELAIMKWEYYVKNPLSSYFELVRENPELGMIQSSCGFCAFMRCSTCPISDDGGCAKEFWKHGNHYDRNNVRWARYWAQKLLDRIKAVEV